MSIGYAPTHTSPRLRRQQHVPGHAGRTAASQWMQRRFGGLPKEYWLLAAGAGMFRLGFFVIPFRAFYLSTERHLTATSASLVMVAFGLGWAASQPVGGWLADRFGRRVVITGGAFASALAFLAFGSARGVGLLAASACAAGLTFDLYRPALSALTADVVPEPAQRKKALAVLYLTLNVGRGTACIIGGVVASHAFWPLFAANALINVAFGIAVFHCVRADHPRRTHVPVRLRIAFKDRRLLAFTGITLVFYTIHMQSVVALPLVIAEHGTRPLQFGLLLALDPLIVAAVQLAIQHKLLSANALHACAAGIATVGGGLAIAGVGNGIGWYAATMPLWIAGEVVFLAVAQDFVAALAPPQRMASYFGLWGLAQGLAALLAPILATVLIGLGGTGLLWGAGAVIGVAAAIACLTLQRGLRHRRATHQPTTASPGLETNATKRIRGCAITHGSGGKNSPLPDLTPAGPHTFARSWRSGNGRGDDVRPDQLRTARRSRQPKRKCFTALTATRASLRYRPAPPGARRPPSRDRFGQHGRPLGRRQHPLPQQGIREQLDQHSTRPAVRTTHLAPRPAGHHPRESPPCHRHPRPAPVARPPPTSSSPPSASPEMSQSRTWASLNAPSSTRLVPGVPTG
ncbi:MFS transporter [Rhizocola hellebori]|uniref:MFS transporter n=1 Tax=Rhizocola hellebori TaxID=1392758 RepID=UPI0019450A1E|nr:MFS transporter [Rhizocola hellebori]